MDILYLFIGIAVGGIGTGFGFYFFIKSKNPLSAEEVKAIENQRNELEVSIKLTEGKLQNVQEESMNLREELQNEREKANTISIQLATRTQELKNLN